MQFPSTTGFSKRQKKVERAKIFKPWTLNLDLILGFIRLPQGFLPEEKPSLTF